jgi:hypothetical protein
MLYELVLVTAVGVSKVGVFTDDIDCNMAAEEWKAQNVAAGCVPMPDVEDAFLKMFSVMDEMQKIGEGKNAIKGLE